MRLFTLTAPNNNYQLWKVTTTYWLSIRVLDNLTFLVFFLHFKYSFCPPHSHFVDPWTLLSGRSLHCLRVSPNITKYLSEISHRWLLDKTASFWSSLCAYIKYLGIGDTTAASLVSPRLPLRCYPHRPSARLSARSQLSCDACNTLVRRNMKTYCSRCDQLYRVIKRTEIYCSC